MNLIDFNKLVERLKTYDDTFLKWKYDPSCWTMDEMLKAVTMVGKSYNPAFVIDDKNRACYENLVYWLMGDKRMKAIKYNGMSEVQGRVDKGIYLYGPTGTGKYIAMKVLSRLAYIMNIQTSSANVQNTLAWKDWRTEEIVDSYSHGNALSDYKEEQMVCFQDLGSEPLESLYMGNRVNVMKVILESRGDCRNKLTLITSNIPLDSPDLKDKYGDRVVSRLAEMCNFVMLDGPDRRKL